MNNYDDDRYYAWLAEQGDEEPETLGPIVVREVRECLFCGADCSSVGVCRDCAASWSDVGDQFFAGSER